MRYIFTGIFCWMLAGAMAQPVQPLPFGSVLVRGELQARALKNFDRLETEIYTPEKVFPLQHETVSADWPGDYEGRVILGLTLQARATGRTPKYLEQMIALIPQKVNAKGYLGPVMTDSVHEQQLSGHGWFLRGLCEYYNWKKDPAVKTHIVNIVQNLALPTKGFHKIYPIDPAQRNKTVGEAAGTTMASIGRWKLSSDIGCDFIFMDGLVQAYSVVPSPELKALIGEMVARFLQMDLVAISAQTHATLTGIRACLRYYALTGEAYLLKNAEAKYLLYRGKAMTQNFENYNWFGRPEWTEPCAIVDAYLAANQLWMHTGKASFLEDAHQVYFNAIGHTQRSNGGFGLDNCVNDTTRLLQVKAYEAYWCCTMRGAEGLAKAIEYNYFTKGNTLYLAAFNNSTATVELAGGKMVLRQQTSYPLEGKLSLHIDESDTKQAASIAFFIPSWASSPKLSINGKLVSFTRQGQFAVVSKKFAKGQVLEYSFGMAVKALPLVHGGTAYKFQYGPLLLGYATDKAVDFKTMPTFTRQGTESWLASGQGILLAPIHHLMQDEVNEGTGYSRQVIFSVNKNGGKK